MFCHVFKMPASGCEALKRDLLDVQTVAPPRGGAPPGQTVVERIRTARSISQQTFEMEDNVMHDASAMQVDSAAEGPRPLAEQPTSASDSCCLCRRRSASSSRQSRQAGREFDDGAPAIQFDGRIVDGEREYFSSFPGACGREWWRVTEVMRHKSVACVFLPGSSALYGEHTEDPAHPGQCYCQTFLYFDKTPSEQRNLEMILDESEVHVGASAPAVGAKVELHLWLPSDVQRWWLCTVREVRGEGWEEEAMVLGDCLLVVSPVGYESAADVARMAEGTQGCTLMVHRRPDVRGCWVEQVQRSPGPGASRHRIRTPQLPHASFQITI